MPDHTPHDIANLTMRHLNDTVAHLGPLAQSFLCRHHEYKALIATLEEAVQAGDLEPTKVAGRALIQWVRDRVSREVSDDGS